MQNQANNEVSHPDAYSGNSKNFNFNPEATEFTPEGKNSSKLNSDAAEFCPQNFSNITLTSSGKNGGGTIQSFRMAPQQQQTQTILMAPTLPFPQPVHVAQPHQQPHPQPHQQPHQQAQQQVPQQAQQQPQQQPYPQTHQQPHQPHQQAQQQPQSNQNNAAKMNGNMQTGSQYHPSKAHGSASTPKLQQPPRGALPPSLLNYMMAPGSQMMPQAPIMYFPGCNSFGYPNMPLGFVQPVSAGQGKAVQGQGQYPQSQAGAMHVAGMQVPTSPNLHAQHHTPQMHGSLQLSSQQMQQQQGMSKLPHEVRHTQTAPNMQQESNVAIKRYNEYAGKSRLQNFPLPKNPAAPLAREREREIGNQLHDTAATPALFETPSPDHRIIPTLELGAKADREETREDAERPPMMKPSPQQRRVASAPTNVTSSKYILEGKNKKKGFSNVPLPKPSTADKEGLIGPDGKAVVTYSPPREAPDASWADRATAGRTHDKLRGQKGEGSSVGAGGGFAEKRAKPDTIPTYNIDSMIRTKKGKPVKFKEKTSRAEFTPAARPATNKALVGTAWGTKMAAEEEDAHEEAPKIPEAAAKGAGEGVWSRKENRSVCETENLEAVEESKERFATAIDNEAKPQSQAPPARPEQTALPAEENPETLEDRERKEEKEQKAMEAKPKNKLMGCWAAKQHNRVEEKPKEEEVPAVGDRCDEAEDVEEQAEPVKGPAEEEEEDEFVDVVDDVKQSGEEEFQEVDDDASGCSREEEVQEVVQSEACLALEAKTLSSSEEEELDDWEEEADKQNSGWEKEKAGKGERDDPGGKEEEEEGGEEAQQYDMKMSVADESSACPEKSRDSLSNAEHPASQTKTAVWASARDLLATDRIRYDVKKLLALRFHPKVALLANVKPAIFEGIPGNIRRECDRLKGLPISAQPGSWRDSKHLKMESAKGGKGKGRGSNASLEESWRHRQSFEVSTNSWSAQQKAKKEEGMESSEKIERSLKATLNKMAPEKFDKLVNQLIETLASAPRPKHLESLVRLLFEKAISQHVFTKVYADTAERVFEWLNQVYEDGSEKIDTDLEENEETAKSHRERYRTQCEKQEKSNKEKSTFSQFLFKVALLDSCQDYFLKCICPPPKDEATSEDERLEALLKYKNRMLGNIKFSGELFNKGILSVNVFVSCTNQLFAGFAEHKAPEILDCMCVLLATTGRFLDGGNKTRKDFSEVFDRLRVLVNEKDEHGKVKVEMRIKFKVDDLIDLRRMRWADKDDGGPKTINQVRADAEALINQQEAMHKNKKMDRTSFKYDKSGSQHGRTLTRTTIVKPNIPNKGGGGARPVEQGATQFRPAPWSKDNSAA